MKKSKSNIDWLKGGLIGGIIFLVLDIILFVINYLKPCVELGCIGKGIFHTILLIALIPIFGVGFILGILSIKAFESQKKIITKSSIIGLIIGLIIAILPLSLVLRGLVHNNPPELHLYFMIVIIPFFMAWMVWVIIGLIQKRK